MSPDVKPQYTNHSMDSCLFSFKKQPIRSRTAAHSAISSIIEPELHILPGSNPGSVSTNGEYNNSSGDDTREANLSYDEQIRAPRMSNVVAMAKSNVVKIAEHEPLGDCDYINKKNPRRENKDKQQKKIDLSVESNNNFSNSSRNTSTTTSNTSNTSYSSNNNSPTKNAHTKQYFPASYDLSQPYGKYSSSNSLGESNSNNNNNNKNNNNNSGDDNNNNSNTNTNKSRSSSYFQLNFARNNGGKQENRFGATDENGRPMNYADIARRALHNLETNTTTSESATPIPQSLCRRKQSNGKDPRERINADGPIRQIDDLKTPNYIPAVLRPPAYQSSNSLAYNYSSIPSKRHSNTSISSLDNNNNNNNMTNTLVNTGISLFPTATDAVNETNSKGITTSQSSPSTSPRSGTSISSMSAYSYEPMKRHWVPNNQRNVCHGCNIKFSLINRRHHCRKCGEIFCSNCSNRRASLNLKAQFDLLNGHAVKVCNSCAQAWNTYINENFSSTNGKHNGATNGRNKSISSIDESNRNNIETSSVVPADWTWSSF
ncbi:hypothetical protein PACTADRAFT_50608 [Pachysolen tannophilus NRRL Y-2460]|uniref:FYVE-type domain-containing protein n=1 Tax=Pachysolen tannophilus NRRL Y-2460 TaxID=669874 RepID=A0A1E4TSL4_PACTA|nr:hypothetical protein PACTADRAFT_50608 [Pachysolen tannophilus NRRL Y-2460]